NVSLIRTVKGKTIYLAHNCDDPRPYSRINIVQGTRGIVSGYPDRVHVEGRSPKDQWEPLDAYREEFEHPLWRAELIRTATGGHGGMDVLEDTRLIAALRARPRSRSPPDRRYRSFLNPETSSGIPAHSSCRRARRSTRQGRRGISGICWPTSSLRPLECGSPCVRALPRRTPSCCAWNPA